jgi:hypothetical protein
VGVLAEGGRTRGRHLLRPERNNDDKTSAASCVEANACSACAIFLRDCVEERGEPKCVAATILFDALLGEHLLRTKDRFAKALSRPALVVHGVVPAPIETRVANDRVPVGSPTPSNDAHVGAKEGENDSGPIHAETSGPIPSASAPMLARAKQTVPPALRRAVVARDHRRCRVPGCRSSAYLDVHHIELRSEVGRNQAENLIAICGAHHRAAHGGQLVIEGTATTVRVRHADGTEYGRAVRPQPLDAQTKVFSALRGLGFREGEVRAVLAQLLTEDELAAATTEQWLRAALARLTSSRARV